MIFRGVFLFTIAGAFFVFANFVLAASAVVTISSSGFAPQDIRIVVGENVEWQNTDAKEHWPASNNHPTHTVYPGSGIEKCGTQSAKDIFDACHGLKKGESFEFTFTKVGNWVYHDHLIPSHGGVIHVYESQEALEKDVSASSESFIFRVGVILKNAFDWVKKIVGLGSRPQTPTVEEFRKLSEQNQQQIIKNLANYSAEDAWVYLKSVALQDGQQVLNAHELSHFVGNAAYEEKGFEGIGICDPSFAYGCYHGVTERFLQREGVGKVVEAGNKCHELFPNDSQFAEYSSCIHGLGHGILPSFNLSIPPALKTCDEVPENVRTYCYDGVFMEFSFTATREFMDQQNPWSICDTLDPKYYVPCARYFPSLVELFLGYSPEEAAHLCTEGKAEDLRTHCVRRIGFDEASEFHGSAEPILAVCSEYFPVEKDKNNCVSAAAEESVFQAYENWPQNSKALCEGLLGEGKEACAAAVENIKESYGRNGQ